MEINSEFIEELTLVFSFAKIKKYSDMSITYHKKTKKRRRKHGFRKREKTKAGRRILARRRKKGRRELVV